MLLHIISIMYFNIYLIHTLSNTLIHIMYFIYKSEKRICEKCEETLYYIIIYMQKKKKNNWRIKTEEVHTRTHQLLYINWPYNNKSTRKLFSNLNKMKSTEQQIQRSERLRYNRKTCGGLTVMKKKIVFVDLNLTIV